MFKVNWWHIRSSAIFDCLLRKAKRASDSSFLIQFIAIFFSEKIFYRSAFLFLDFISFPSLFLHAIERLLNFPSWGFSFQNSTFFSQIVSVAKSLGFFPFSSFSYVSFKIRLLFCFLMSNSTFFYLAYLTC